MIFNEEQTMLQDTLRAFLADNATVSDLRALRANPKGAAYNQTLWQQLIELGIPGIALSESEGGLGFGYMGLAAVMHEMGRNLVASPIVSSVALASSVIQLAGSDSQKPIGYRCWRAVRSLQRSLYKKDVSLHSTHSQPALIKVNSADIKPWLWMHWKAILRS